MDIGKGEVLSEGVATRVWSMNWPKKVASSLRFLGSSRSLSERRRMLDISLGDLRVAPVGVFEEENGKYENCARFVEPHRRRDLLRGFVQVPSKVRKS